MTQRSAIPFSPGQVNGDVFNSMKALNNIVSKNDGIRAFSVLTNNCYDSDQGFTSDQQTHIRITNSLHDINQIDKTYIRMTFEAECTLGSNNLVGGNVNTTTGEAPNQQTTLGTPVPLRIFLGWKNSNECIKQLEAENMNIDTNYLQTECAKEGFAYSTFKPREEKRNRRYVHSRWEDVYNYIPGVCGCYFGGPLGTTATTTPTDDDCENITASEFYSGSSFTTVGGTTNVGANTFTVSDINVILPITDLLAFQCFTDFPTGLGDIVLKFFVNKDSMVWAVCDPEAVYENTTVLGTAMGEDVTERDYDAIKRHINKRFTQIGQSCYMMSHSANDQWTSTTVTLNVSTLTCTKCQCECFGYNITQECKRQLVSLFTPQNPFIIPAQQVDIKYFANQASTNGQYSSDFTYALHNVTDFLVVFPRSSSDITCFTNPSVSNLQLRVDGKLYPNQLFDNTYDHRFIINQMNAADFSTFYEADQEYLDSFREITHTAATGRFLQDQTSFICIFQAERNSEGFFFDGLETGNQNVNIQLQFNGNNITQNLHSAAPQCWFVRDTYWTVDNENGLRYWKTGTPATYASAEDATVA